MSVGAVIIMILGFDLSGMTWTLQMKKEKVVENLSLMFEAKIKWYGKAPSGATL